MTVLLVDESAVMRKVLTRALRQAVLDIAEILEAGDGNAALSALDTNGTIELVLCDWNMHDMSGLEFVTASRRKGHRMPIVLLTTEGGHDRNQQASSAGANGLVTKPFTPEKLADALGQVMSVA